MYTSGIREGLEQTPESVISPAQYGVFNPVQDADRYEKGYDDRDKTVLVFAFGSRARQKKLAGKIQPLSAQGYGWQKTETVY